MTRRLEQIIFYGLIAAIIFTALAHGAVETWSLVIFELLIILLVFLWGLRAVVRRETTIRIPRVLFPLVVLLLIGLTQGLSFTNGAGQLRSISMDVEATRQTTTILFILTLALLLATNFLARRHQLMKLTVFLTAYGLVMAMFGLIQHFAWNGKFYWWRQTTDLVTSPYGPFVAHNHFAGYLELLLPIPIALVVTRAGRIETRIFYLFCAAMMGGAALASLSRGGFISLFVELVFLGVMAFFLPAKQLASGTKRRSFRSTPASRLTKLTSPLAAVLITALAIGASIYWIGLEPVLSRISKGQIVSNTPQEETFFVSRGWIWRDTYSMIKAHPFTGVGFGAFETAFPIYSQSDGSLLVGQAHNDFLQIIAEVGVLGGILALWFLVLIVQQVWRGMRLSDPLMAGLSLGGGASVVGMAVHSLFDFNLQLPSHALLLLVISAIVSQASVRDATPVVSNIRTLEPLPESLSTPLAQIR